jgi:hypothetical protein
LVIVSRVHRSQADNRKAVRARLVKLLQRAAEQPKSRRPTKPRRTIREEQPMETFVILIRRRQYLEQKITSLEIGL